MPSNEYSIYCKDFLQPINKGIFVSVIKKPLKLGHSAQEEPIEHDCTSSELHRELDLIVTLGVRNFIYGLLILYGKQRMHSQPQNRLTSRLLHPDLEVLLTQCLLINKLVLIFSYEQKSIP